MVRWRSTLQFANRPFDLNRVGDRMKWTRGYVAGTGSGRRWMPHGGISPNTMTKGLIGLNAAVFCMWHYANPGPEMDFMVTHFVSSVTNLFLHGNISSLVLPSISHVGLSHIAINLFIMYQFAPLLSAGGITGFQLLGLYVGAGIASNLAHLASNVFIFGRDVGALGASGSVNGILAVWAFRAYIAVGGFALVDLFLLRSDNNSSNAGHIGGLAYGLLYYYLFIRRRLRPF